MNKTTLVLAFIVLGWTASAWAHGSGAGGGHIERPVVDPEHRRREDRRARQARLERLAVKIEKLEIRLDDPKLTPKKRAKLEKKLKKLYDKKDRLLDE